MHGFICVVGGTIFFTTMQNGIKILSPINVIYIYVEITIESSSNSVLINILMYSTAGTVCIRKKKKKIDISLLQRYMMINLMFIPNVE